MKVSPENLETNKVALSKLSQNMSASRQIYATFIKIEILNRFTFHMILEVEDWGSGLLTSPPRRTDKENDHLFRNYASIVILSWLFRRCSHLFSSSLMLCRCCEMYELYFCFNPIFFFCTKATEQRQKTICLCVLISDGLSWLVVRGGKILQWRVFLLSQTRTWRTGFPPQPMFPVANRILRCLASWRENLSYVLERAPTVPSPWARSMKRTGRWSWSIIIVLKCYVYWIGLQLRRYPMASRILYFSGPIWQVAIHHESLLCL